MKDPHRSTTAIGQHPRLTALSLAFCASAALAGPPKTDVRPVTDTIHGTKLTDDYRWLEGDNSDAANMGRMSEEVAGWTDAQNGYTRSVLDNLPGRKELEARLRPLMEVGSVSTPTMRGNRYFYSKREGTQAQSIVYLREGHDGESRPLLDPSVIDSTGLTTVSWYVPNEEGTLLAFGMYRSGDEKSTLYVLDVDTGGWLAEEIPGKVGGCQWLADSSGFFYERLENVDDPYSSIYKLHKLGTHHSQDKVLFRQRDTKWFYPDKNEAELAALAKTWGPFGVVDREARWLVIGYWTGTSSCDFWACDLDRWSRTGELVKTPMVLGKDGRSGSFEFDGDTLYMDTQIDASNGRAVAIDLHNPSIENWKDVIPERKDAVLQGVGLARGVLVADYIKDATTLIEKYSLAGKPLGSVELPGIGSGGVTVRDDRTEGYLAYSSYNEPYSIYRIDLASNARELWERPDVPVDPSLVEVKQVWYSSKDGTRVPMFIVHKKGLKLDGNNPTILYGYGGFNIPMQPGFSATMFPWYEAGGVYAVACIRGGGEYGNEWHRAGMLENKQNVFDDFIAAGEWLVENGYTSPEHLGIAGGSNGGLLTGTCVTQRPDLFAAAIVAVPLLDMVRFQDFLMARYWVPEYGSAENADQFEYIVKYSPYQNIKKGVKYPATLVTAGENDTRVHPMHARKFAAALQAATSGSPEEDPIFLWVDRDAGHGQGKPLELRIRDVADQRIFMMWQLGMLDKGR
ncbi:MAG: prolyl oligopeptidase family serine peptidase [Phycisphaerales bacterium]|nr:prolyl oligopeptidase family serine peptidase [Phycisphaerales bacterium]